MNLRDLCWKLESGRDVLAGRPACLLFQPYGMDESGSVDTPGKAIPTGESATATEIHNMEEIAKGFSLSNTFHPDSEIEWLIKSDRNPFANLITIGRARNNDLILSHPSISKLHCTLTCFEQEWQIQDSASTNGTYLNGVQLKPNARFPISDGDHVGVGSDISARFFTAAGLRDVARLLA